MKFFSETFRELESWKDIEKCIKSKISPVCATGLSHIHKAQFIYSIYNESPILVITESEAAAKNSATILPLCRGMKITQYFFPPESLLLPKSRAFQGSMNIREFPHFQSL